MNIGRINWVSGLVAGLSTVVTAGAVQAFDSGGNLPHTGPNSTNCLYGRWDQGSITYPGEWGTAWVTVGGPVTGMAGGIGWRFNTLSTHDFPAAAITASMIENACGYVGATVISQQGATAASFTAENYMGVVWQAKEQSDGSLFQYEVALSGATGTIFVNSRTLITPETVKPVITAPAAQAQGTDLSSNTAMIDVTGLGSATDNVDGTVPIVYKIGTTVLSGAYAFPVGVTTVTMDTTDSVGNAADQVSFTVAVTLSDNVAPTASIAALVANGNGTYNAAITLSEVATNFDAADLTVTNGSATLTGSGLSYTAVVTPAADGLVSLMIPAGGYSDGAGNVATVASNTVSVTHDTSAPSVAILGAPTTIANTAPFTVTVSFSEPVTGFVAGDLSVTNGSVTGLTGGPASYSATIAPNGGGDVSITVPAGVATDMGGNVNLASLATAIDNSIARDTEKFIAQAAFQQANGLIAAQPNLTKHLTGNGTGSFDASVTRNLGTFDYTSNAGNLFWFELHGSKTTLDTLDNTYSFGAFGRNFKINENLLVGGMLQLDYSDTTKGTASHTNQTWLVGPYAVVKAPGQPLYFEASALFGRGKNDVTPLGTYTDQYDNKQMIFNFGVSGEVVKEHYTLRPSLRINHVSTDTDAYTDSLGNLIQASSIGLTQGEIGLDAVIPQDVARGEFDLLLGVSGIYSHTSASGSAQTVTSGFENGRGRIDLGISRRWNRTSLVANAFYDGIGASNYKSTGAEVGFVIDF